MTDISNRQLYSQVGVYSQALSVSPENEYKAKPDAEIAALFASNFDYFKPKDGLVSQAKLREIANRPVPTGNTVDDAMTMLAREITSRGSLNYRLDKVDGEYKGPADGMISLKGIDHEIASNSNKKPPTDNRFAGAPRGVNNAVGNANRGLMNPVQNPSIAPRGFSNQPEPAGLAYSKIASDFKSNFSYFQDADGFVSMATIAAIANRLMTNDPFTDRMTWLAQAIISSPTMTFQLDSMTQNGQQDGLISARDAQLAVDYFQPKEMPFNNPSPWQRNLGNFNQGMQPGSFENSYGGDWAYNPTQAFGSNESSHPLVEGMYAQSQERYMSPEHTEVSQQLKNADDSELAMELRNNFDYFKPNENDKITQASLREIANRPMLSKPEDDRMTSLAKEILSRPTLNGKMDSDHTADNPDGIIGRDTVGRLATPDTSIFHSEDYI